MPSAPQKRPNANGKSAATLTTATPGNLAASTLKRLTDNEHTLVSTDGKI
jgi:hypothetical protein